MKTHLLLGEGSLEVEVPDSARILSTEPVPPVTEPDQALREALRHPIGSPSLAQLAEGKETACIIVCDHTRPAPTPLMLRGLLEVLAEAGIKRESVTILVAAGLHREPNGEELAWILGEDLSGTLNVVSHRAESDNEMVELKGVDVDFPVFINQNLMQADLKIATGLIEPHLCAGYSGGCKMVAPGVGGRDTIRGLHRPAQMDDLRLGPGVTEDNPFLEETRKIGRAAGLDFVLNLAVDRKGRPTGIFAGHPEKAHEQGIAFKKQSGTVLLDEPADVVLTCGGGAPLDRTLYQTVKGVCGAARIVRPGGAVIVVTSGQEGAGGSSYEGMLDSAESPEKFLEEVYQIEFFKINQWGVQQYYRVMTEKDIYVHAPYLSAERLEKWHFHSAVDLSKTISYCLKKYGNRLVVIPEGPYLICQVR